MAWGHPVKDGKITSDYGPRDTSIPGASRFHQGTDFGARGTDGKVRSVGDGKVHATGWNVIRGWWVAVRHGDGSTTTYQHLVKPDVSNGQSVSAGTILGTMGVSGVSSGAHLHFEAFPAGTFLLSGTAWVSTGHAVDPEDFMLARGVNLADPSDPVKVPEHRPDEPTTPGTPTTSDSEDEDMRIIQRGTEGSFFLIHFSGYQKITQSAKDAFVAAGVPFKQLATWDSDVITSTLREKSPNRTLNPAITDSVWREQTASYAGGEQETMAAHLLATRKAADS
jgi:hypothetical protein